MNLNTFKGIRQQMYESFERGADGLFNLCDALLSESQARSIPELSQSPLFERQWSSLYQALKQGKINTARLQQIWLEALIAEMPEGETLWVSVDASSIARPEAYTSEDRGIIHVSNLPRATKPISVGWQFSTLMLLPQVRSSWVGIVAQQRISTKQTAIEVAIAQLQAVLPLLKRPVIVLADRWYATADFLRACQALGCQVLIRLKSNRKLYRRPLASTGKRGRPALDGSLLQPKRTDTLGQADEQWSELLPANKSITVRRWTRLHFRQAREVEVTVVQVQREGATDSKRDPRESWFVQLDAHPLPLSDIAPVYAHRFSHEHGYRFLKQDLLWTQAHVRTPEQFECWSLLVGCAMNQLCLARTLGQASYRPWERRQVAATPRQIRRVIGSILMQVGTPARRCQRRGKSPGRPVGFHPVPVPRYAVVIKGPKTALKARG